MICTLINFLCINCYLKQTFDYYLKSRLMDLKTIHYFYLLIILVSFPLLSQSQAETSVQNINVGEANVFTIAPNDVLKLSLKIEEEVRQGQSLYISAKSIYNDPFQQPHVEVSSSQNFYMKCSQQFNDFVGVCQIDGLIAKKGSLFKIEITCEVECFINLSSYISEIQTFKVGQSFQLINSNKFPLVSNLLVQIPEDLMFNQIYLIATSDHLQLESDGLVMLANYGSSAKIPTLSQYQAKAETVIAHQLGIFLSEADVKPGQKIYLSILLPSSAKVVLRSNTMVGRQFDIYIGVPVEDFVTNDNERIYVLNLQKYTKKVQNFEQSLQIKFAVYSGMPHVSIGTEKKITFESSIIDWQNEATYNYQIGFEQLKSKGYKGKVYIKVESSWTSNYRIEVKINTKQFIDIKQQVVELVSIKKNELKNLIYIDDSLRNIGNDSIIQFKAQMITYSDKINLRIRNFQLNENKSVSDYIVKDRTQITKELQSQFSELKIQREDFISKQVFKFNIDVTKQCTKYQESSIYTCSFHLLVENNGEQNQIIKLIMSKDIAQVILKQGQNYRDSLEEGQIKYYWFYLPESPGIKKISIYSTVIQGKIFILASQKQKYPTIDNMYREGSDTRVTGGNNLVIQQQAIKKGMYYIGVLADYSSDYLIGVSLERQKKNENTEESIKYQTEIKLEKGQAQTVTMPIGIKQMYFTFTVSQNQLTLLKINQVQGSINYTVIRQSDNLLVCDNQIVKLKLEDSCKFDSKPNEKYTVAIFGKLNDIQIFSISYSNNKTCIISPWNYPLQFLVNPGQSICLKYFVYQQESFHVYSSLPAIEVLQQNIEFKLQFDQKFISINNVDRIFTKKQVQRFCNGTQIPHCSFNIIIKNTNEITYHRAIHFMFIVQTTKEENVLFDNIQKKAASKDLSTKKANKYFYYISDSKKNIDIHVVFRDHSRSLYQICAKVILSSTLFDFQNSYPNYNQKLSNVVLANTTASSDVATLLVNKQLFRFKNKTANDYPILLISVFGLQQKSNNYQYQIQVIQGVQNLPIGESRTSTIYQQQIQQYTVNMYGQNTVIQLRSLDDDLCVEAFIDNPAGTDSIITFRQKLFLMNEIGVGRVVVTTKKQICSYQISYKSLRLPILALVQNTPYDFTIDDTSDRYFVFRNEQKQSFRIFQLTVSGSATLYAQPLKKQDNVTEMINNDMRQFAFSTLENEDLLIDSKSQKFCVNCYYLIGITPNPNIKAELIIAYESSPIVLKQSYPFEDEINQGQKLNYQFYSEITFNLTVSLLYGKVNVLIIDPEGKTILEQKELSGQNKLLVPGQSIQNIEKGHFYDQNIKHKIIVTGLQKSRYLIKANKKIQGSLLVEGISQTVQLSKDYFFGKSKVVSFYNAVQNKSITLLVEDYSEYQSSKQNVLNFKAFHQTDYLKTTNLVFNIQRSQGSYYIQILARTGIYHLQIQTYIQTNISILLTKKQFSHIAPGSNVLMMKPSIFQLYGTGTSSVVIQLFTCKNELKVRGATDFKLFNKFDYNQRLVQLQHGNYGGHYVIIAQKLEGQYFIEVSSSDENIDTQYLISTHTYERLKGQRNPYELYEISKQAITYSYFDNRIQFTIAGLKKKFTEAPSISTVSYNLYISNSQNQIQKARGCGVGNTYKSVQQSPLGQKSEKIMFEIQNEDLKKIIGSAEYYYASVEAVIYLTNQNKEKIQNAYFLYDLIKIAPQNQQIQGNSSETIDQIETISIFIVLPLVIASVLLFLAVRYLIKIYRNYRPTQLIEEQDLKNTQKEMKEKKQDQSVGQSKQVINSSNNIGAQQNFEI